jgi:UDP-N-acetylmuramoyl-L-alanyl-D-glutamate--2,6-diaminopimelate ligase
MPQLHDILIQVAVVQTIGTEAIPVTHLCIDSRSVQKGSVFIALSGSTVDGHDYIDAAIEKGAAAIVCMSLPALRKEGITYVQVKNSHDAAGKMAAAFYGFPAASMQVVAITGTNGKTTTATLLFHLFEALGYTCGLISTVQNHIHKQVVSATHTTPDALSLQALLAQMRDAGCTHVFMEASSHAIQQRRIAGIRFAGAVFTNISHDHLDYHHTFDEYIRVKKSLFDALPAAAFALSNADDKRGMVLLQNTAASKNTYSLRVPATFKGKVLENNLTGLIMQIDGMEAHFRMIGTFNAYNLLGVYGTAILLGEDKMQVLAALSNLHGAPGRFETYRSMPDKILGIVDYAHTPDALLNVLAAIKQLNVAGNQVITVIGCGGDRDKAKRPLMAAVACEHSSRVILTADNPRSEDPETILNEMESGLTLAQKKKMIRIADRREAIKTAVALAQPEDIVLVAGKGHENYQEIKGVKHHFDDREILMELFQLLHQ